MYNQPDAHVDPDEERRKDTRSGYHERMGRAAADAGLPHARDYPYAMRAPVDSALPIHETLKRAGVNKAGRERVAEVAADIVRKVITDGLD